MTSVPFKRFYQIFCPLTLKDKTTSSDNLGRLLATYFLTPLFKTGSLTIVPMFVIWLWATNQMRLRMTKKIE